MQDLRLIFFRKAAPYPLCKFTSRGRPKDVAQKRPDVLKKPPSSPICNAKGRIPSGASLVRTQDLNLTIIHKMSSKKVIFFTFPDSNYISGIVLPKLVKNLIRSILVLLWWTLCAGWVFSSVQAFTDYSCE